LGISKFSSSFLGCKRIVLDLPVFESSAPRSALIPAPMILCGAGGAAYQCLSAGAFDSSPRGGANIFHYLATFTG
jgi:hypothetical protein